MSDKPKLTIGVLRKFLEDNKDLPDDVCVFYPHYYKGNGLANVGEIERGQIPSGDGVTEEEVVVLDWDTTLHCNNCFLDDSEGSENEELK